MNTFTQVKITKILFAVLLALSLVLLLAGVVEAQDVGDAVGEAAEEAAAQSQSSLADEAQRGVDAVGSPNQSVSFADTVIKVINGMLFAVGILSVIMIIVGGIRFVVSAGDSNGVQAARNTILYSVVGLVVAFVAWGIVNFVTNIFTAPPAPVEEQAFIQVLNSLI